MLTPYVKIVRDLRADLPKNVMLAAAIALGVLGVGTILGARSVLTREMARNYLGTVPAHATLEIRGGLPAELVTEVRRLEGVGDADRRATVRARMQVDEDWYPMLLFVVDDFDDMRTNRFTRLSGEWPPPVGTMLVERTARAVMRQGEGGQVLVRSTSGTERRIAISGLVHDPGLAPAWQEQQGYGYVSIETLHALDPDQGFDELRIRLADPRATAAEIEEVARGVARFVRGRGYTVDALQVPPPRSHPHQSQMTTVLLLLLVFSFAILVLSAVLLATALATLMTRQLREIGIMKTLGAGSGRVASLYLMTQGAIAGLATLVAVPASRTTAALMTGRIAELLNLEIIDASVSPGVTAVQAAAGLLVPLAVALVPVWRGSRITVRKALSSHGLSSDRLRDGAGARALARLKVFTETGALAARNVFRQPWRLGMSLVLLAAGGGLFLTALDVSEAWDANLAKIFRFRHYDVETRLDRPLPAAAAVEALEAVPGVRQAEAWQRQSVSFSSDVPYPILHVYPDKGHGSFTVLGVPPATEQVDFPLLAGRWLREGEEPELVLNHTARGSRLGRQLRVGDRVSLDIAGRRTVWNLVGFVEDLGAIGGTAYVPAAALARVTGLDPASTNMVRVALDDRSLASAFRQTALLERALGPDARVSWSVPMALVRNAVAEHMEVLVRSLLALSALMAIVGGFGLASTMSMNILERTREIGVMRAIGATPARVARLVVAEGFVVSALSLGLALGLAVPLSALMSRVIGAMAFRTPLPLVVSGQGVVFWIAILGVGTALATLVPAQRAARMTVRDALQ